MPGKSESTDRSNENVIPEIGHELISGLTQLLVLLILKKGPQHGYELASMLEPIYGQAQFIHYFNECKRKSTFKVNPLWYLVVREKLTLLLV
ncbi:MAG: hypothetical protein ACTSPM_10675 [Candidatus Heimdallarchaeota archaeon]